MFPRNLLSPSSEWKNWIAYPKQWWFPQVHRCVCVCVCIYIYIYTYTHTYVYKGPGSVVGIATVYGLDGPGIESRWVEIFRTSPDRP